MSISEQIKELRKAAKWFEQACFPEGVKLANDAADTIESLSAKLQVENMERSGSSLDNEWIYCNEWLPSTVEYMELESTPYMKRLEIAYMKDTVEYLIGFYDGSKWMDKHHNIIKNVIAWKPFLKLPDKHHES